MQVWREAAEHPSVEHDIVCGVCRGCEILVASAMLLVACPAIAFFMMLIRLGSSGPAILAQKRIGRHGEQFTCYKLRTMFLNAPVLPTHAVDTSHYTKFGMFLRKTGLDELPQLWNVVNGTMRIVGPRPSLPTQGTLIAARRRHGILDLHPGITGLAQVRNIDMSDEDLLVATDAIYVRQQSLAGDFAIVAKTAALILRKCFSAVWS